MLRAYAAAVLLLAATAHCAFAEGAASPQPDPYASPIEQCIRDNASKVEATIPDINQAVDFLVGKVCAATIAEHNVERTKLVAQKTFERVQRLCEQQTAAKQDAKPDDAKADAAKPVAPTMDYCALIKNASQSVVQPLPYDPWASGVNPPNSSPPPAAVALASQLLLSLRAARRHREN